MAPADGTQGLNDLIADEFVAHGIDLLRYEAGARKRIQALLSDLEKELVAEIAKVDPTGVREGYRAKRLAKLLEQVRETIRSGYRSLSKELVGDLKDLAGIEASFVANTINGQAGVAIATSTIAPAQLTAIAGDVLVQGAPVADWWSRQAGDVLEKFTDQMRVGIAAGETSSDLIRRVRGGRKNGELVRGFMEVSRRNADSLVRSATQAVAEAAKETVYEANADIMAAVVWTSTLDSRTTVMCAVRDGKRYTVKDHKPIGHSLPWDSGPGNLHWGCRSTSRPETKSWRDLGLDIDDLPPGTRASMDGQVAADLTFENWLSKQSTARQDAVLGNGRADLWRDGKITFRDLLDQNGRELSLEELRRRVGA